MDNNLPDVNIQFFGVLLYLNDKLEIICVNDGSTDDSLKILNEYKEKNSRVIVINQTNKGLSGARNAGLSVATGDYIALIDSDDWIHKNYFELLLNTVRDMRQTYVHANPARCKPNCNYLKKGMVC